MPSFQETTIIGHVGRIEKWRDILGYEGEYQVSDMGKIRSLKPCKHGKPSRLLKTPLNNQGYPRVSLSNNGFVANFRVHILVLEAFVCPRPNSWVGHHINHNKADNRVSNLLWCTTQMNNLFSMHHHDLSPVPPIHVGEEHPHSKLTVNEVREIRAKYVPRKYPQRRLAKEYGVCKTTISNILHNLIWDGA